MVVEGPCYCASLSVSEDQFANIHSLKSNCLTTGRAAKLASICHLKRIQENFDEAMAMCTDDETMNHPLKVSPIHAGCCCYCENSSDSGTLLVSDR